MKKLGTDLLKRGFAKMVKHGVVMDVTNVEQALIAEEAGAAAVMALERVPADIRVQGGVARMSDPEMILEIKDAVSIPVMAKARIGHYVEAQVLESIGVDMVDESEVLTPADEVNHIDKRAFTAPFVCGARNLGEALRRIDEGAAMIRTKGEAGTGNVVEAVKHMRAVNEGIARVVGYKEMGLEAELIQMARNELKVPMELISEVAELKRLPVVNFAAGGIATPADAALMMQMGCDGVFVGSGIFKSGNPATRAKAIVEATYNFDKADVIGEVSKNLGEAMVGINIDEIPEEKLLAKRGI
ncbi:pyridoxal 5'-phosphate synthase lyase subunit PdxS [Methanococcus maripaludis]|uniref:Pyridoxal 5'-phosphate synthase subunit PdxS n=1 Tax=Methanococcus maripaludis TaxID=39152 RepID=A0A2L1CAJ9_METMI|nr:pyridoxal 5'-phosphate synthase lyase subunit PdxS [Methanococcus maripaludis]AVB76391.1 Pyridoxal biosynthesis lyase PdxS [Methanococcus maripaludis]MBA2864799.1 pyridoxal 5'-phosphate synthase pdxS subunit [Methanococcus maripaludis]MBB6497662.1 pyridoxal 5'-phosphate synthase pdxS subunit [Methanococcus maripaludis]